MKYGVQTTNIPINNDYVMVFQVQKISNEAKLWNI
jgi:hypothetical protein